MGSFTQHTSCPKCSSSDAYALYGDGGGGHCYSCGFTIPSEEFKEENPRKEKIKSRVKLKEDSLSEEMETKTSKPRVTEEQTRELKEYTSIKGSGYRGIRDETLAAFGVRTEYNEATGAVQAVYYPCTIGGELSGWKPRVHPKTFGGSIGITGKDCELFGQFKFKNGGKTCLIVGGEHDVLGAYQMLKEYYKSKSWDFDPIVVSPTIGETGCAKQLALQYEWFALHDKVIIGFDQDEAGKNATEKIISILPKGKVFIANWSLKDPNEMLLKGKEKQFISDFYNAKAYVPAGVLPSTEIFQKMLNQSVQEKISLPPVFRKLSEMLGGGLTLSHCYTISGVTGGGKTSLVNEMVYHWIFNSPYPVGIVSLELSAHQYGEVLLSRHLQTKIAKMDHTAKFDYLNTKTEEAKSLFEKEDGSPRFVLLEDRDASFEQFKTVVEEMVVSAGVRLVIIDPWTDIGIDGLSLDEQANAMKWIKSMIKSHFCSFVLINHVRKSQGGSQKDQSSGGMISEHDIQGSSTVMKSSSANILLVRNKMADDLTLRNTTNLYLSKNRLLSDTGPAGDIYYDSETHTLHELDDWLNDNSIEIKVPEDRTNKVDF